MKSTKSALRLDPGLVHEAEMEAILHKRTTPKQIEYWAEIGKLISEQIDPSDLLAVSQGIARVEVKQSASYPLNPKQIFGRVEEQRESEYLVSAVTTAAVRYEADPARHGVLIRINGDGSRDAGHFKNGKFKIVRVRNAG